MDCITSSHNLRGKLFLLSISDAIPLSNPIFKTLSLTSPMGGESNTIRYYMFIVPISKIYPHAD